MPAYIVGMMKVSDSHKYSEYRAGVSRTMEQYGGRFLVRGGALQRLEGDSPERRMVVVEFESMEALQRFWNSPEYEALKKLRQAASDSDIWAVQGV
jgi:uncharacterized protein (DUF1330 family)